MRSTFFALIFVVLATTAASSQTTATKDGAAPSSEHTADNHAYKLFPTQNVWTFIKLDTRNGKMWQVQFDVVGNNRGVTPLNLISLVSGEKEVKGRYTLYPTQNIYNFLLLDQIDGYVYQVQWSAKEESRIVVPIL